MSYLARLKQLEKENNSPHTPDTLPSKPTEPPFGSFGSTDTAHIDKNIIAQPEPSETEILEEQQREARRLKVIAMLERSPGMQRAVFADTESDLHNVILTVAIRHPTPATCEMLIQKAKYDPWKLLELIERHGQTTH